MDNEAETVEKLCSEYNELLWHRERFLKEGNEVALQGVEERITIVMEQLNCLDP